MPDIDEGVELRALQARAYGRDGVLSGEEAERLRELERVRTGSAEPADGGPAPATARRPEADAAVAGAPELEDAETPAPAGVTARGSVPTASLPMALRVHWRATLVVLVLALALGVGLGWLVFGHRGAVPMELTAEQRDWQNDLIASGQYDAGSLRAMREEENVVVWFATRSEGAQVCLVLGDGETTSPACAPFEQARAQGVYGSLVKTIDENQQYEIGAQLYLTAAAEPAVIAYSYLSTPGASGTMFSTPEEAAVAAELFEAGFDRRYLVVVGYDEGVPLWVGRDLATQRLCLIHDGTRDELETACDENPSSIAERRTLILDRRGDDGTLTRYEYVSDYGAGYLTITREGDVDGTDGE